MVNLLEVTFKRPTGLSKPVKVIGQRVIGQEDMDGREVDVAWADLILMGMQEGGFLPHTEGELIRTV